MSELRFYCGKAPVLILHKHKRKAQIRFLEDHDQIFGVDKVNRVRHFSAGETCVTLTRLLWRKRDGEEGCREPTKRGRSPHGQPIVYCPKCGFKEFA